MLGVKIVIRFKKEDMLNTCSIIIYINTILRVYR